ncbi:SAP domain-containing protein [Methylomonas koyamae]|uniref:SAP domain-containing protein n=1 Tax=Methylomonas koyamae TaxID=702114 RepID=UPI000BC2E20C|nr:SAP domain-containing protein [Methylomonas koyamae]ATG90130.1 SAP domain-containing protein [Methylomonas koyamae]
MNTNELHTLAKSHGIDDKKLSKLEVIRNIQTSEGNFDCFATAYAGECDQEGCCWREDCFESAKACVS